MPVCCQEGFRLHREAFVGRWLVISRLEYDWAKNQTVYAGAKFVGAEVRVKIRFFSGGCT